MTWVLASPPVAPMDPLSAAGLGVLQGLTEFLPVSSSGHVSVGAYLFGIRDMPLSMVVIVHAGTLLATLLVFRRELLGLGRSAIGLLSHPRAGGVTSGPTRELVGVALAAAPTAVLGLALAGAAESWTRAPSLVGACMWVTAAALWTTRRSRSPSDPFPLPHYLWIGCAQGLAVLPGISRSGATIAVAMLLGMRPDDAFRFSFLLSIPTVMGAVGLELSKPDAMDALGSAAWIAGGAAFVVGWAALLTLRQLVNRGRLWMFALYLVPLGLALIVLGAKL